MPAPAPDPRNIYQTRPRPANAPGVPAVDLPLTQARALTRNRLLSAGLLMVSGLALAVYLGAMLQRADGVRGPKDIEETPFQPSNITLRDASIGYNGRFPLATNNAPISLTGVNVDQVFASEFAGQTNVDGTVTAPLPELALEAPLPLSGEDDLPSMLVSVASRFLKAGDYAEAEATLQKALAQRPDDLQALRLRGTVLLLQSRHAEAEALFSDLVKRDPYKADCHNHLGVARLRLGKVEEARAAFAAALKLNHDYADALLNLALLHLIQREFDRVPPLLSRLVTRDPSNPKLRRYLSTAYYEMGDPYQARLHLQELVRLQPNDAAAYFDIARCYVMQDQRQEAMAWLTLGRDHADDAGLRTLLGDPVFEPLYTLPLFRREFGRLLNLGP